MKVLYRISDKSNDKAKLPYATKENCLRNAIAQFGVECMVIFADNCSEETIQMIQKNGLEPHLIALGNAGSLRHIMQYAMTNYSDNEIIYLLEDDYFHLDGAARCIEEGLEIADYLTLYDHPDKYLDGDKGGNPLVKKGGEKTRLLLTKSSHWKKTNSTTMTYACRVGTLKKDFHIWKKHSGKNIPKSFYAYKHLTGLGNLYNKIFGKRRILISPVPAKSTHAETSFLSPLVNWSQFKTHE